MATKARAPYEDTKVPVYKTRGEIDDMLRAAGATGMAWMDGDHPQHPGCRLIALRFIKPEKVDGQTVPVGVRLMVPIPVAESHGGRLITFPPKEIDQRLRAYHRSMYHYLKAQLDVVARGLVQFTEAFLPHLELPSGQTVYQTIGPQYLQGVAQGDIRPLALLPDGR